MPKKNPLKKSKIFWSCKFRQRSYPRAKTQPFSTFDLGGGSNSMSYIDLVSRIQLFLSVSSFIYQQQLHLDSNTEDAAAQAPAHHSFPPPLAAARAAPGASAIAAAARAAPRGPPVAPWARSPPSTPRDAALRRAGPEPRRRRGSRKRACSPTQDRLRRRARRAPLALEEGTDAWIRRPR